LEHKSTSEIRSSKISLLAPTPLSTKCRGSKAEKGAMWKHHGDDAWVIWGVWDVALPLQELEDNPLGGQREILWCDFFLDPLQWWDHRSKKVIEHQSC